MFDDLPGVLPLSPAEVGPRVWLACGADAATALEARLPPRPFSPWLFNTVAHGLTQPGGADLWLAVLVDAARRVTLAQWIIWPDATTPHHWQSPGRAPFAGPQLATITNDQARWFLQLVVGALRRQGGCRSLRITLPPPIYDSDRPAHLLTAIGFTRSGQVETAVRATVLDFPEGVRSASHRRKLILARQAGLTAGPEPATALPALYAALAQWRTLRDHRPPPPLPELAALLAQFPAKFPLFAVRNAQGEPVALALTVRVCRDVLYYYLPASDPAFDNLSPALLLLESLHEYAQLSGIGWLDLGPSLDSAGNPSPSLAEFKRRIGADSQFRRILEWRA